jgi:MFS transporter, SET family, sugar efflux transporter
MPDDARNRRRLTRRGTAAGPQGPQGVRGVTALAGVIGAYGIADAITSTTGSLYLADALHVSPLLIGLFFVVRAVVAVGVNLAGGSLSDRLRDRRILLGVAGVAGAIGAACLAVLRVYAVVLVTGTVFLGIGGISFFQLFAYAKEMAEANGRPVTRFTSALRSVFSAAWVIGPPFGFYLLTKYGFGWMYVATGGLFLATAVLGIKGLPGVPARPEPDDGTAPGGREAAGPRRMGTELTAMFRQMTTSTRLLLAAIVVLGTAAQMYGIDVALYITNYLHLRVALVGWVAGLSAGLEIPVMIAVGRMADRIGKLRVFIVAGIAAIVYYCLLPVAGTAPALLGLQFLNAPWMAVMMSIPMVMVQQEAPGGAGAASSLYSTAFTFAALLAGAITGVTASAVGFRNVFWICGGLSAVAVLLLVIRVALGWRQRTRVNP